MRLIILLIVSSTVACTTDARTGERAFSSQAWSPAARASRMVIAHEAVAGLMPAMSMAFDIRGHLA